MILSAAGRRPRGIQADRQHVESVIKCAECQLRTGPFKDKFSDEQINKAKQDSVDYCKAKGFDA